jgi:Icc-related predicted phosphoesterase
MKICAIGDPHGSLDKITQIPLSDIDLILLTGDLGSASLMRKMAFDNIERKKQGLDEIEYTPKQEKKAFMEAYDSSIKLVKYLSKFAPVYTIFGNVESSNKNTKKHSKEINLPLPYLYNDLNLIKNVKVINNRLVNFNGIRIGGLEYFIDTSWVRDFKPSDYKKRLSRAKKQTDKAKKILNRFESLDILLCHQPPYGVLDKVTAKFAPKD